MCKYSVIVNIPTTVQSNSPSFQMSWLACLFGQCSMGCTMHGIHGYPAYTMGTRPYQEGVHKAVLGCFLFLTVVPLIVKKRACLRSLCRIQISLLSSSVPSPRLFIFCSVLVTFLFTFPLQVSLRHTSCQVYSKGPLLLLAFVS